MRRSIILGGSLWAGLLVFAAGDNPTLGSNDYTLKGTIDISNPSAGIGWTYGNGIVKIINDGEYTIVGSSDVNRLAVDAGVTTTVTLQDVHIRDTIYSPLSVLSDGSRGASVTLRLRGANELVSVSPGGYAGVSVGNKSLLVIEDIDGGSLYAQGGSGVSSGGAGIGNNSSVAVGSIVIRSGVITAQGGEYSAGIGGGGASSGGTITISGGNVRAIGGTGGAGIGGGEEGSGGTIRISGGVTVAYGPGNYVGNSAGVGAGGTTRRQNGPDAGAITITGGTLYAFGGYNKGVGSSVGGGDITITGGTIVAGSVGVGDYDLRTTTHISGDKTILLANFIHPSSTHNPYGDANVLTGENINVAANAIGDDLTDVTLNCSLTLRSGTEFIVPAGVKFDFNGYSIVGDVHLRVGTPPAPGVLHDTLRRTQRDTTIMDAHDTLRIYKRDTLREELHDSTYDTIHVALAHDTLQRYDTLPDGSLTERTDTICYTLDGGILYITTHDTTFTEPPVEVYIYDTITVELRDTLRDTFTVINRDTIRIEINLSDTAAVTNINTQYYGVPIEVIVEIKDSVYADREIYEPVYVAVDRATGVEYTITETLPVTASGNSVLIAGLQPDKPFEIYTLSGERCLTGTAWAAGTYVLSDLWRGTYIVYQDGRYCLLAW